MRTIEQRIFQAALLVVTLLTAACGGGGGSSGSALSVSLTPSQVTASFYAGTDYAFGVIADVGGTVNGAVVTVVVRDTVGVIQPQVGISPITERRYSVNFVASRNLLPGRHTGTIQADLCSNAQCSQRFGGASLPFDFTVVPAPTVAAVLPASVLRGTGLVTITLTGTGFTNRSVVTLSGGDRPTTFVSTTQLTATIEESFTQVANVFAVAVRTPLDGAPASVTSDVEFIVRNPVPTLATLTPSSVLVDGGEVFLTVDGTGFTPDSRISLDGAVRIAIGFVSSTEFVAAISPAELTAARLVSVTVANPPPGGGTSNSLNFAVNNPVPVIAALDPGSTTAGCGATTVAVSGSGFRPNTTVLWNGGSRPTTYTSASRVTIAVGSGELASAGSHSAQVTTPAPGGGTSAPVSLLVQSVGPPTTSANAARGNALHNGEATVACPTAMSASPAWTYDIGFSSGILEAPLVASGKVFASTTTGSVFDRNVTIRAVGQADGTLAWGPFSLDGYTSMTYDGGRLFVVTVEGVPRSGSGAAVIRAYNAVTGALDWTVTVSGNHDPDVRVGIVAANGALYLSDLNANRRTIAVAQSDGHLLWESPGSVPTYLPAVTESDVYLADSCNVQKLDAQTGVSLWGFNYGCSGGTTPGIVAVAADSVFAQGYLPAVPRVYQWGRRDLVAGALLGGFGSNSVNLPSFRNGKVFQIHAGTVEAIDLATGGLDWYVGDAAFGTATFTGSTIVVNDTVIASNEQTGLFGFDVATGKPRWRTDARLPGENLGYFGPVAGDGWLVVSRGFRLEGYRLGTAL